MALALVDPLAMPAAADDASPRRRDWQSMLIVGTPLIATTWLSKLSVAPLGKYGIGLEFPLTFAVLLLGIVTGRMEFASRRLALFMIVLALLGLLQLVHGEIFSLSSLALMGALGLAYCFHLRQGELDGARALAFFENVSALIAALGIAQFAAQFVVGVEYMFPIERYVPDEFRTQAFNNMAPLFWGSPIFRSNGIVMLEPSFFSQLCALGLIVELSRRARALRLALYGVAMVVSYSGTGVLILAVTLPVLVVMHRRWDLLLRGLMLVALIVLLAGPLNLDVLLDRVREFDAQGSSGFARFVAWQSLFSDRLWSSTEHALFGYGAGSFVGASAGYHAAEMAYSKIIFEFGVLGALAYFSFILYCLFSSRAPFVVRLAVVVCYFMNGAYSPTVTSFALSLLLWPALPPVTAPNVAVGSQYGGARA